MSKQKKRWLQDYRDLFAFSRPQLGLLSWAVLCMVVSTIFDGVSLSMIVPFSDKILSNSKIVVPTKLPAFAELFIDKLNGMSQLNLLVAMAGFLVVMFFLKNLFSYFQGMLMSDVGQRVMRDMR
ncbi:MAG: hypothetical protein PHS61_07375, partial [Candidatus Omnitrophica bacterium]|nr:hypothetical protein [Candidatus Omnitrophota bacterium]